jgi:hypothetical protein
VAKWFVKKMVTHLFPKEELCTRGRCLAPGPTLAMLKSKTDPVLKNCGDAFMYLKTENKIFELSKFSVAT